MLKKIFVLLLILLFTTSFSYASKLNLNTNHKPFIDVYQRCGVTDLIEVKPLTLTQLQIFEIDDNCYGNSATLYLTDNVNTFKYSLDTLTKASPVIYLGEDTNKINTNTITDAYLYIDGWPYKTDLGELWEDEQELPLISCIIKDTQEPCNVTYVKSEWVSGNDEKNRGYKVTIEIENGLAIDWQVTINYSVEGSFIKNYEPLYLADAWDSIRISESCETRTFVYEKPTWDSSSFGFLVYTYSEANTYYCPPK